HIGVINEYGSTGGRDAESDDVFRQRIKEGPDILARGVLSYLTQAFMKVNPNVLRVIYEGVNQQGKVTLGILTVNGIDLTDNELQIILEQSVQYFSLTELNPIGSNSTGVELKNVDYYYVDVDMRVELFDISQLDSTVIAIQQKFAKLVDFRFWESSLNKIEWEDLLLAVKNTPNVKHVADAHFSPIVDITIPNNQFPRFRGFIMRDLDGDILQNQSGVIDPIFYPNEVDDSFTSTVL
ncbi:MAG TPA: baseplate J/gp47 family protein, partial [Nitrososphaeraceae archaeon]|nr:baseplate J/gp47 family protein [Nitrososphaeraceae archaeon]